MSLFKSRKKFTVSERDPVYKVRYLGNVQTSMMRGDGCVDKPTHVLWNNFMKTSSAGLEMTLSISASGLKAVTKEQGLTEYRAHRISYCIAHPRYPKVFVWVYRHEGKKLKVELRCHAVICKSEAKAKAMAVQLHDKLASALAEFMREKCRRQSTRLSLQRTNSLPSATMSNGLNARNKFLSTGGNFKPPVDRSASAPKLGCIAEDMEPEEISEEELDEEDDVDELDNDYMLVLDSLRKNGNKDDTAVSHAAVNGDPVTNDSVFGLEVGNDVAELKNDSHVRYHLDHIDSDDGDDDDSSESGFSEQDLREGSSNGSTFGSDPQLAVSNTTHIPVTNTCTLHQSPDEPWDGNHNGDATRTGPANAECTQCGQLTSEVTDLTSEVSHHPNISLVDHSRPAGANKNKAVDSCQASGQLATGGQMAATSQGPTDSHTGGLTMATGQRVVNASTLEYNPVIINERRL